MLNRVFSDSALLRICARSRSRYSLRRRRWIATLDCVGERRLSSAERRSVRRDSNSQIAVWRAWSLPVNSRSRACRASGIVLLRWVESLVRIVSLSFRVEESGVRVVRVVVRMVWRFVWEVVRSEPVDWLGCAACGILQLLP